MPGAGGKVGGRADLSQCTPGRQERPGGGASLPGHCLPPGLTFPFFLPLFGNEAGPTSQTYQLRLTSTLLCGTTPQKAGVLPGVTVWRGRVDGESHFTGEKVEDGGRT